jgi:signal transduction histidine kinase
MNLTRADTPTASTPGSVADGTGPVGGAAHPLRGLSSLRRGRADAVLAVAAAVVIAVETLRWQSANHPVCLGAAVLAGLGMSLRRTHPLQAFLVSFAGLAGIELGARGVENESVGFLVVYVVALYSLGRHATRWRAWVGAGCVVGAMVGFYVGDSAAQGTALRISPGNVGFAVLFVGGPWTAGLAMRLRRQREQVLRSRNEELVRHQVLQAEQVKRAIDAERARIARELHDVVSHALSVSVLQARGARRMLGEDDAAVTRALDAIEHTNAQALGDMRRLLSVLRDSDEPDDLGPQPSLARLGELVSHVEASGVPVGLTVTGGPGEAPPGVELSAYRIVQEALTNVLRHAGPGARAAVELSYGGDHIDLAVVDTGDASTATASSPAGRGSGLIGIRERVAVVGGSVTVGPEPQGGFAIRARLPYTLEAS